MCCSPAVFMSKICKCSFVRYCTVIKLAICSDFCQYETWAKSQVQQVLDHPKVDAESYRTAWQFYMAKMLSLKHFFLRIFFVCVWEQLVLQGSCDAFLCLLSFHPPLMVSHPQCSPAIPDNKAVYKFCLNSITLLLKLLYKTLAIRWTCLCDLYLLCFILSTRKLPKGSMYLSNSEFAYACKEFQQFDVTQANEWTFVNRRSGERISIGWIFLPPLVSVLVLNKINVAQMCKHRESTCRNHWQLLILLAITFLFLLCFFVFFSYWKVELRKNYSHCVSHLLNVTPEYVVLMHFRH